MFAAGSATSPGVVIWAMSELVKNPKVMDEAKAADCLVLLLLLVLIETADCHVSLLHNHLSWHFFSSS